MNTTDLFTAALGLTEPWYVSKIEFVTIQSPKKIAKNLYKGNLKKIKP